jgi:homoserine kinase
LKFPVPPGLQAVVCIPERPLSTLAARQVLPKRVPLKDAVFTASRTAFLVGAFLQKRFDLLSFAMQDVLHQPARSRLMPGFTEAVQAALKAGAYGSALSGAGSTVIAFAGDARTAKRAGGAMQRAFQRKGVASRWMELALENQGVRIQSR